MSDINRVSSLRWDQDAQQGDLDTINPAPAIEKQTIASKVDSDPEIANPNHISGLDSGSILFNDRDFKQKQYFAGWLLAWLSYQSIGVVYGDIGTSTLYVFSSTFTSEPSYDDLIGALSLIIWSITLIVTVKYVAIVLHADDEGEGGTFALFSLLTRYSNIVDRDPRAAQLVRMKRYESNELRPTARSLRKRLEKSRGLQFFVQAMAIIGVALILADGVLTPAQTVLGAIQGFKIENPDLTSKTIVGASCGILVFLYLIQPIGVSKLASTFAPIVIIWLCCNACFGIYVNIMGIVFIILIHWTIESCHV